MGVLAFLLSIMFIPGLPSAATAPRWSLLALVVPFMWYRHPGPFTIGHLLGLIFLAWCALTLVWSFDPMEGVQHIGKFVLLGLLFCVGAGLRDLRSVYIGAALGVGVNSVLIVLQYYGWDKVPQIVEPAGLFFNKNFVAEFAAMVLAGLVAERLWWLVPLTLPAVVLCHSRGSWMALGVAGILLIYQYNRRAAVLVSIATIGAGVWLWHVTASAWQRWDLWRDTWAGMTFWGRGLGSYFGAYPEHGGRIDLLEHRPSAAHNDLLQLFFEIGPGALVVVALLVFAMSGRRRPEHYVVAVFLVEGLVGFPFYLPATAFLAALALGALFRERPDLCGAGAWRRLRVLPGQSDIGYARAGAVSLEAGAGAVSLRSQRSRLDRLFLHRLPLLRSTQRSHPSH